MQLLAYLIVYPFLWLISILPFRILYGVSDFLYFFIYRVFRYRTKTVKENLDLVFPDKTTLEKKKIQQKFYHHLSDIFLEMIKTLSAPKSVISRRFIIKNPQELKRLESLNKSIILMYGHYASYEWSIVVENHISFKGYGVYKRIANKYFDSLVKRIRRKYNTTLIHTKESISQLQELNEKNIRVVVAFVSDQSPKLNKAYHWTDFMGIPSPCYTGAEMLAKKLNHSVAFLKIEKVKRGFYEGTIVTLADNPSDFKNYDITDMFTKAVESQIYNAPEYYLWTHKRWKHRDKAPKEINN